MAEPIGSDSTTPLPPTEPPALWRNVSFHLLWISTFASGLADRLITNATWLMLGVGDADASPASIIAAIDFFFFLPYVVWSPFAGWIVDRLPRKWVMFAADEIRGLTVLTAFLIMPSGLAFVPPDHQWKVYLVIVIVGMMAATFVAAKLSIVPNVVGYRNLQRANSMVVSMGVIGNLLGFLVAAQIGDSARVMVVVSALAYMISGTFWAFIATPFKARGIAEHGELEAVGASPFAVLRQIVQGARYAFTHRPILVLIVTAAIVWGGTSIYQPALGTMNREFFGNQEPKLFILLFMVGFGMLLGSLFMAVVNPRRGGELLMVAGLIGCGVFIGLQMVTVWYGAALVVALLTGVSATVLLIPLYSTIQRITADHIRGRVFAAKEILTEAPKVLISLAVWMLPQTEEWMRYAGGGLSLVLLAAAFWGVRRYVLVGPAGTGYLNFMWRFARLLADAVHRVRVIGKHRYPATGAAILVSNHTAGVDPVLIQSSMTRVVRWMMAKEYMIGALKRFWAQMRMIGVDRKAGDSAALRDAIRELRDGGMLGIFPEGHIGRDRSVLNRFAPGVGAIVAKSDPLIVPVFITGTPVVDSPFASYVKPSRATVVFGEPFRIEGELDRAAIVEQIRARIEALRPIAEASDRPADPHDAAALATADRSADPTGGGV